MEMERPKEPPERVDEPSPEEAPPPAEAPPEPVRLVAPAPVVEGLRCPFCHETIAFGAVGAGCQACDTLHHVACFAERDGCSVTGCQGRNARTRTAARPPPPPRNPLRECASCKERFEDESWVLACGCGRHLHAGCAPDGRCGRAACSHTATVGRLGHVLARRDAAGTETVLTVLGLFGLSMLAAALVTGFTAAFGEFRRPEDRVLLVALCMLTSVAAAGLGGASVAALRQLREARRRVARWTAAPPPTPRQVDPKST